MASLHLLKRKDPCFQSPAKVFAKLKSKVQKEAESEKELMGTVREQHGVCRAVGPGFNTNLTGFGGREELKENNRFGSHQTKAQALTLSPISSPEKTFDFPCSTISCVAAQEDFPLNDTMRGFTRRNRALMESTAVSLPLSELHRDEMNPQIADDFIQPTERCGRRVFNPKSPPSVYSPMKKRLRKRKLDPHDSKKASRTTEESSEDVGPSETSRRPAVIWDHTSRQVRGNLKGFPSDPPEPKFQDSRSNGLRRELFPHVHPFVIVQMKFHPVHFLFSFLSRRCCNPGHSPHDVPCQVIRIDEGEGE